jgi:tetratricopeptide (TPR) repeat protein
MQNKIVSEDNLASSFEDLKVKIQSKTIDRKDLYKSIIQILRNKPTLVMRQELMKKVGSYIDSDNDLMLKELLKELIEKSENLIRIKPRWVLEMLHSLSGKKTNISIPLNLYIYRGKQYIINNDFEKAIELFTHVHQHNHNTCATEYLRIAYFKLSEKFSNENKYDQAAQIISEYNKIDPNDTVMNHKLAILTTLYTKMNRIESINASWTRILKLWHIRYRQTKDTKFRDKILSKHKYFVAKLVELQKWKIAKEELENLLEIEPENSVAKRAHAQI